MPLGLMLVMILAAIISHRARGSGVQFFFLLPMNLVIERDVSR